MRLDARLAGSGPTPAPTVRSTSPTMDEVDGRVGKDEGRGSNFGEVL